MHTFFSLQRNVGMELARQTAKLKVLSSETGFKKKLNRRGPTWLSSNFKLDMKSDNVPNLDLIFVRTSKTHFYQRDFWLNKYYIPICRTEY